MTTLQRLQLRQSEIREKLNMLLGRDERSENETAELESLTGEGRALEVELRAALIAEDDPLEVVTDTGDPETRGTARDSQPHRDWPTFSRLLPGGVRYPALHGSTRTRADVRRSVGSRWISSGTASPRRAPSQRPQPLTARSKRSVPYVFQRSAAASLGIEMPSHGAGAVQIPRVTTAPPKRRFGEGCRRAQHRRSDRAGLADAETDRGSV